MEINRIEEKDEKWWQSVVSSETSEELIDNKNERRN